MRYAYIARRACGCTVGALADNADELADEKAAKERTKHIAATLRLWVLSGYRIDRVPDDAAMQEWYSGCTHEAKRLRLDVQP